MSDSPIFRIVLQRHPGDCCVAVLSTLLGVSYEETLMAASADCPRVLTDGMRTNDMKRAAARLGYRLKERRRYDIDGDIGALTVVYRDVDYEHVVLLLEGWVLETDGVVWEAETFFSHHAATPGPLFVAERLVTRGKHG